MTFHEKVLIEAARRLQITSRIELHGLPARYNCFDDNIADELVVWGKAIKDNYVKVGVNPKKIHILNLKKYKSFDHELRLNLHSLETVRILIVTKSENEIPHSVGSLFRNPSMPYDYIEQIFEALKSSNLSVKVFVKPHPSELELLDVTLTSNLHWEDYDLIIGPSSTMLLDALNMRKPYLLYEPLSKYNLDLQGNPLVPPFDGVEGLVSAFSLEVLKKRLNSQILIWNNSWANDYAQ
jgi:hypothetical protein